MPPDCEAIASGLKPSMVSDVVELATGLQMIKIHERRGSHTTPLTEVRDDRKQFLDNNQHQSKLSELIGHFKAKEKIQTLIRSFVIAVGSAQHPPISPSIRRQREVLR